MPTVSASRLVRAMPAVIGRALTPAALVEYEDTFTVNEVSETDDGWVVAAGRRGLDLAFAFEAHENGFVYEQRGDGPLETLETTVTYAAENEGTRVKLCSTVSTGLPLSVLIDRVAAWKRRGELRRALDRLAADVE
jgi:hypothetical protein